MRLSILATAISFSLLGLSIADNVHAAIKKQTNIPAQGLGPALQAFAKDRDLQIVYISEEVNDLRTRGVAGEVTADEALRQLLDGTDLGYRYLDENTVTVFPTRGSRNSGGGSSQGANSAANKHTANDIEPKRSFWQRLRLAQADQPASANATSTSTQKLQAQDEQQRVELEEIVVTGTYLRGATPIAPITLIDRAQIESSGKPTVSEVLETLPQNVGGGKSTFQMAGAGGDSVNFAFGAGVDLRGLGNAATLVLLNGHRVAPSGFGDFVDLSSIPVAAVERIEVLPDGASALYGSDAVAGVVNIIVRKDYDGAELSAQYGSTTDGAFSSTQATGAVGSAWGTGSAFLTYNYLDASNLDSSDRSYTATQFDPTDLILPQERHSVLGRVTQDVGERTSLYGEALYSTGERTGIISLDFGPALRVHSQEVSETDQLTASAGADISFGSDWNGNLGATYSVADTFFTNPNTNPVPFESRSKGFSVDSLVSGAAFDIWGGPVRVALGVQFRSESYEGIGARSRTAGELSRDIYAGFGEVHFPIVGEENARPGMRALELSAAGRIEDYSDFGSTSNPKFGIKWAAFESFAIRATTGKSFHAPLLSQLDDSLTAPGGRALASRNVPDPLSPTGRTNAIFISQISGGPDLQPETSTSWTAGFDIAPAGSNFRASATYFNYDFEDKIAPPLTAGASTIFFNEAANAPYIIRNPSLELATRYFPALNNNFCACTPADIRAIVDGRLTNISRRKVDGIDLNVDYARDAGGGKLGLSLAGTYLFDVIDQANPRVPEFSNLDKPYKPVHLRMRGGATWTSEALTAGLFVNYVSDYSDARFGVVRDVDAWTTIDLSVDYTLAPPNSGVLGGVDVLLAIQNILDEDPPFVQGEPSFNLNYDSTNANPIGRFASVQLRKRW